jgi:hypothetical protein
MENRLKSYDVPHKALRNGLSQLSLLAGKTDYENQKDIIVLYNLGHEIFTLLTVHANDENEVTLADLNLRCPGCSEHDVEDHKLLHDMQSKLETSLTQIYNDSLAGNYSTEKGEEFYLALSEFHGMYLEHTAEEERVTQILLWKHFTDEELANHRVKIMKSLNPETLLLWLKFAVPAQSQNERIRLLSGFKKMANPQFYDQCMSVIYRVLPLDEFERLK